MASLHFHTMLSCHLILFLIECSRTPTENYTNSLRLTVASFSRGDLPGTAGIRMSEGTAHQVTKIQFLDLKMFETVCSLSIISGSSLLFWCSHLGSQPKGTEVYQPVFPITWAPQGCDKHHWATWPLCFSLWNDQYLRRKKRPEHQTPLPASASSRIPAL